MYRRYHGRGGDQRATGPAHEWLDESLIGQLRHAERRRPEGYVRPDARLYEEVCEVLSNRTDLDVSDIEVTVAGGVVTLAGAVSSRRAKLMAEALVDTVRGVKDIDNRLRVVRSHPGGAALVGSRTARR
jgi:osmotically-inducible protein OsmY